MTASAMASLIFPASLFCEMGWRWRLWRRVVQSMNPPDFKEKTDMKRVTLTLAMILALVGLASADKKPTQGKVRVYVSVPAAQTEGFVTPGAVKYQKGLEDSAKDLRKKLKKDDWLGLADEEGSDLKVSVVERDWLPIGTYTVVTSTLGNRTNVDVKGDKNRFLIAEVYADGAVVITLINKPGVISWGQAAGQVKDRLKAFAQENYAHILSLRTK